MASIELKNENLVLTVFLFDLQNKHREAFLIFPWIQVSSMDSRVDLGEGIWRKYWQNFLATQLDGD